MHTLYALYRILTSDRARNAFRRLKDETVVLLEALLSPGKVIAEVEAIRALHLEAARIEATQPVRAAVLRRQAATIGLR